MTDQKEYEFDVAFSFLKEDEIIASNVNDLIQDRIKTFIYSKNQEGLVGFDGEEKFHDVFGKKSRLVVIFYKQNWGQTPWTRIEMTALKNRSLDQGYGFTIFVPLDKSPLPIWLPKTIIWFNFERWGTQGLASVIESKLSEEGVEVRKTESAIDFAKRKQREIKNKEEIERYLQSEIAAYEASQEFQKIFDKVKEVEKELRELKFNGGRTEDTRQITIKIDWYSLTFFWQISYSNSLSHSYLLVRVAKRANDWEERQINVISSEKYDFHMDELRRKGWIEKNGTKFYESEALIEKWTKELLSNIEQ
jgi:hypothetical protein